MTKSRKKPPSPSNPAVFRGSALPTQNARLVGYSALIEQYDLDAILPECLALISPRHVRFEMTGWSVYSARHMPDDTFAGHLGFALRYEGVDLSLLCELFKVAGANEIEQWVRREPVGRYSRRAWFFYEWLTGVKLKLPNATTGNYVNALDPKQHFVGPATPSKRHRVHDNLPGVQEFCPLVRRTAKLESFLARDLQAKARQITSRAPASVLARAAAFLLLNDSRASFAIEGERPGKSRAERWSKAIGQAGINPLSIDELTRLQRIVIDSRFVEMGLRRQSGFIGTHDFVHAMPIPDHISARWQDVERLIQGLIATDRRLREGGLLDPVIAAALIAFGFVFIHPFVDGNGRIHRYLIHHALAERGFAPKGIVFPISAVILDRIAEYRQTLETYSRPRLERIDWRPAPDGNVEVLSETFDLYRFFDATKQAEFLYDCVAQTIEHNLPEQLLFLERYDRMKSAITERFDMPDHTTDLMIRFLRQNKGKFSKRAMNREFKLLTHAERRELEALFAEVFPDEAST